MSRSTSFALSCLLIGSFSLAQQEPDKSLKAEDKDPSLIRKFPVGDDVKAALWSGDGSIMTTTHVRKKQNENDVESPKFKTVKIWDARNGKVMHSLGELNLPDWPYQFLSHDGSTLAIRFGFASQANELEIWDTARANMIFRFSIESGNRYPHSVALSRDGKMVAQYIPDTRFVEPEKRSTGIELFDATTGKRLQNLREEKSSTRSAVFTHDGKNMITLGSTNIIRLWDVKTGKVVREAQASANSYSPLYLSPDGKTLVIPTKETPLQVWDVPSLKTKKVIATPFFWANQAAFSSDSKLVAIFGRKDNHSNMGLIVWDLEKHQMVREWDPGPRSFAFVDATSLAVLDNGEVKIFRLKR